MKGDLHCEAGRLMRHDPQFDDPELVTDIGECPDCSGDGCGDYGEPVSKPGRSEYWRKKGRPRFEDRGDTIAATKPWLAIVDVNGKPMSRSTWYRRQAEKRTGKGQN